MKAAVLSPDTSLGVLLCHTSCELHGLQSKLWRQSATGAPFRSPLYMAVKAAVWVNSVVG